MRKAGMTQEFQPRTGSMAENPWCGLSLFEGLPWGHGTKFNKGHMGINYKVIDLM